LKATEQSSLTAPVTAAKAPRVFWPFVVAFLAYLPSLRVGFLTDDFDLIAMVADVSPKHWMSFFVTPINVFYRPLYGLSLYSDYALWHLHTSGYHLTNITLHAVNSLLVYRLASALDLSADAKRLGAFWFAINPAVIGAVGWVSGRADLLATLFTLSAALLLLRWHQTGRKALTFSSFALGLLGLFSKETGVVFIFWSLFLGVRSPLYKWRTIALALAIAVIYCVARIAAVGWLEPYFTLADMSPPFALSGVFRFFASMALPLSDAYFTSTSVDAMAAVGWLLAIGAGCFWLRIQRFGVALSLFVLSLVPALAVLGGPRSLYHSRHYYLPCVAASLVIGLLGAKVAKSLPRVATRPLAFACVAYLFSCLQLNIHHWARNSALAAEIATTVAACSAMLPAGHSVYVTGYRDMDGPFFPFHGNTIQQAIHLYYPQTRHITFRCLGQNRFCEVPPAPAGSAVVSVSVERWQVVRARLELP
jgi:hypothetical protein